MKDQLHLLPGLYGLKEIGCGVVADTYTIVVIG
jgi:hypothetical protein